MSKRPDLLSIVGYGLCFAVESSTHLSTLFAIGHLADQAWKAVKKQPEPPLTDDEIVAVRQLIEERFELIEP
jgi:hypothetical protein